LEIANETQNNLLYLKKRHLAANLSFTLKQNRNKIAGRPNVRLRRSGYVIGDRPREIAGRVDWSASVPLALSAKREPIKGSVCPFGDFYGFYDLWKIEGREFYIEHLPIALKY
jgi:hypothetical protein